jgi:hypothetical protein
VTKAADMEERAPGAAETELNKVNDPEFTAERRVCCLLEHTPEREVTVGYGKRAEPGTAP